MSIERVHQQQGDIASVLLVKRLQRIFSEFSSDITKKTKHVSNQNHRTYLNLNNNQIKKCEAITNFNYRSAQIDMD